MSNEKPIGPPVIANDGLSSALLQKGLSSGNLKAALNNPPPPPPAQPSSTQGSNSQGTAKK